MVICNDLTQRRDGAAKVDKDGIMKNRTRWIRVLMLGGLLAASAGWADETAQESRAVSREQARQAQEAAAREAAKSVRTATELDLDIRLIGPTSLKVARGR